MSTKTSKLLIILESAIANVQINEEVINKLNVFPVPDGDTGSNMLATLLSGWNAVAGTQLQDIELVEAFAKGTLFGARGNSGVIVSQIIKGFAVGVKENKLLSTDLIAFKNILKNMKNYAYKSVSNPVEGTILSIVKSMEEKYNKNVNTFLEAIQNLFDIAKKAVEETPNQLPILKEAEVVDSGAYGLMCLIEGILLALQEKPLKINTTKQGTSSQEYSKFVKANAYKNVGYCTEFIMTIKEDNNFKESVFKTMIEESGDSVVYIKEDDIIKVHIHTQKPEEVLARAHEYGEFSKIKIENMSTQITEMGHEIFDDNIVKLKKTIDPNKLGIIAVSNGSGFDADFLNFGVTKIISGGQTMNPSVNDFKKVIDELPNKEILLLPNNSNIVLTCELVQKMYTDKKIHIIPTKSLQQGIVSVYNLNNEMIPFDGYIDDVVEAVKNISDGYVTNATRNIKMNNIDVKKGNYISLQGKKVISSDSDLTKTSLKLIDHLMKMKDHDFLTIYFNDEIQEKTKEKIQDYVSKKYPNVEFSLKYGGQAIYQLLLFAE